MDKDLRGLVVEIVLIAIMLILVVPICVEASGRYKEQKEALMNGTGINIDITYSGDVKNVIVYSKYDNPVRVNLILKINKISNDYDIYFDDNVYNISELDYIEDDEYRYYRLGIYEVDESRTFDFKIKSKGSLYYDETIIYSFLAEGLF